MAVTHFARLTNATTGEGEWVNPANVTRIRRHDRSENRTEVYLVGEPADTCVLVKGSAASVAERLRGVNQPES